MLNTRHVASLMLVGAVLFFGTSRAASAQSGPAFTVKFAIDPSLAGHVHGDASGTIDGVPYVINSSAWTDTHSSNAPLFVAGVDFPLSGLVRSLVNVEYGRVGADPLEIGSIGADRLVAEFEPYEFFGLEAGVRVGKPAGPYAIGTAGFRHVDSINITITTSRVTNIGRFDFYDTSNVPSFGFGGGFMFGAFGLEVMAKYAGSLTPVQSAAPPAGGLASDGARWSLPISLLVRF